VILSVDQQRAAVSLSNIWNFHTWWPWLSVRLLHSLLYILGAYVISKIWGMVLKRISSAAEDDDPTTQNELERRVETVTSILKRIGNVVLIITVCLMVLSDFGVKIGPLLAGLGVAGVALGFGSQYLVRDIISGFFIVLENQFRVGDVVKIGEYAGTVEKMYLRTTQLRSASGDLHVIPNGRIEGVTNLTRVWSRAVLEVGVSYASNLDLVFEALREVAARAQQDDFIAANLKEPLDVAGVTKLGDSAITVRLWGKVEPLQQWAVERALNKLTKEVFDERGIEIPFPQVTLSLEKTAQEVFRGKP